MRVVVTQTRGALWGFDGEVLVDGKKAAEGSFLAHLSTGEYGVRRRDNESHQQRLYIHPTAIVHPEAKVDASCEIGPFCTVGPHAVKIGRRTTA